MMPDFDLLKSQLEGDLYTDNVQRVLYSTDASQYKEMPLAVTRPKNKEDVKKIIEFARKNGTSVIPRGAGTSLAGQVVGQEVFVVLLDHDVVDVELEPVVGSRTEKSPLAVGWHI